jgi:anti-sigma28 factor (negative regulator of flagellin synthesis)
MVCCPQGIANHQPVTGGETMQIRPTTNVQTSQAVNLQTRNTTDKSTGAVPVDQLDISAEAQMLSNTQSTEGIRADRVADIRTQIAEGNYETSEKLEAAISQLLDEIV